MNNYISTKAPWKEHKSTIQSVILEEGVESIGRCALSECEALKGVSIPSSITIINSNPLTDWPKLARIEVSEDNNEYSTMNGVLFDKEKPPSFLTHRQ